MFGMASCTILKLALPAEYETVLAAPIDIVAGNPNAPGFIAISEIESYISFVSSSDFPQFNLAAVERGQVDFISLSFRIDDMEYPIIPIDATEDIFIAYDYPAGEYDIALIWQKVIKGDGEELMNLSGFWRIPRFSIQAGALTTAEWMI